MSELANKQTDGVSLAETDIFNKNIGLNSIRVMFSPAEELGMCTRINNMKKTCGLRQNKNKPWYNNQYVKVWNVCVKSKRKYMQKPDLTR